jgi:hypothetical protein
MATIEVKLTENNSERANVLSRQTGKTPERLVNEAFERFAADSEQNERQEQERCLAWRQAAMRVAGIWAGREDLPDFEVIRRSMDRDVWERREQ